MTGRKAERSRTILKEQTRIEAPPEQVFRYFEGMEKHYEEWHPDHITFSFEPDSGGCEFTQRIKIRTGPIGRWLIGIIVRHHRFLTRRCDENL